MSANSEQYLQRENAPGAWRANLSLWVKAALLLGLGIYFASVVLTGNLKNYTDPQFAWLAVLASGLFLVLGLVSSYDILRARREGHDDHHDHHAHDHSHDHGPHDHDSHQHQHGGQRIVWPVLAVVAIPLVLGVLVPSRPLGSGALSGNVSSGFIPAAGTSDALGPPLDDPTDWTILDWQRAFNYKLHPLEWFHGKQASVVGFVDHPASFPKGHFVLARWVMYHCAVDARGVGMVTAWDKAADFSRDTWVQVRGTVKVAQFQGEEILVLYADQVDIVPEPDAPYLRPRAFDTASSNPDTGAAPIINGTKVNMPKLGISADLPGSGWTQEVALGYPGTESERWDSADKSLRFAVFLFPDYKPEGRERLKAYVEDLAYHFQITSLVDTREERFHNYDALRTEGIGQGQQDMFPSSYRFVEYWFEHKKGLFLVVAGAKQSYWDGKGAAEVKAILDNLRIGE
jgi:putative membrane protein